MKSPPEEYTDICPYCGGQGYHFFEDNFVGGETIKCDCNNGRVTSYKNPNFESQLLKWEEYMKKYLMKLIKELPVKYYQEVSPILVTLLDSEQNRVIKAKEFNKILDLRELPSGFKVQKTVLMDFPEKISNWLENHGLISKNYKSRYIGKPIYLDKSSLLL